MHNINLSKQKLPKEYEKIYKDIYLEYANSNTFIRKIISFFESWYHIKIRNSHKKAENILEIGAGALNHVKFEKNFTIYDVIEPKKFLFNSSKKKHNNLITNYFADIKDIPKDYKYDKIISIAVLEHVEDLKELLAEIKKRLVKNGSFIVAIPAEGEFLWWLGWRLTSGISFWLKYKLDYGVIMRFEHINKADYIINLLNQYFFINEIESFPTNLKNLRLYIYIKCTLKD